MTLYFKIILVALVTLAVVNKATATRFQNGYPSKGMQSIRFFTVACNRFVHALFSDIFRHRRMDALCRNALEADSPIDKFIKHKLENWEEFSKSTNLFMPFPLQNETEVDKLS